MNEPESVVDRLSRLTPDRGTIDRDALIFAAGHRSAGNKRGWKATAGILAAGQLLTLVFLWPHSMPSVPTDRARIANDRPSQVEQHSAASLPYEWLQLRERLLAGEHAPPPKRAGEALVPDDPPLHPFPIVSTLLN